jgi:hypothetical protein
MIRILVQGIVALSAVGCTTPAMETGRVKDLSVEDLQKKGKRLSAEEVRALITNATVEGRTLDGTSYTLRTNEQGTYTGTTDRGQFTGKWSVNEKGQACYYTAQRYSSSPCTDEYVMDGRHYSVTSSGVVLERKYSR